MNKYFIKGTNLQINEGDDLKVVFEKLTKKELELLVDLDVVEAVEPNIVLVALQKLADKANMSILDMDNFIYNLNKMNSWAAFILLLKQVAIIMDKKYPDHIMNANKLFYVSSTNLKVEELPDKAIINPNHVSLFRTIEEAKKAIVEISEYLDYIVADEQEN